MGDLSNPDVTTKYRACGDIVNKALQKVVDACVDEADIATICELGDKIMEEETGKLYNKKPKGEKEGDKARKIEKGIAFPTCISVNEIAGHFSPLKGESRQPIELVQSSAKASRNHNPSNVYIRSGLSKCPKLGMQRLRIELKGKHYRKGLYSVAREKYLKVQRSFKKRRAHVRSRRAGA